MNEPISRVKSQEVKMNCKIEKQNWRDAISWYPQTRIGLVRSFKRITIIKDSSVSDLHKKKGKYIYAIEVRAELIIEWKQLYRVTA